MPELPKVKPRLVGYSIAHKPLSLSNNREQKPSITSNFFFSPKMLFVILGITYDLDVCFEMLDMFCWMVLRAYISLFIWE